MVFDIKNEGEKKVSEVGGLSIKHFSFSSPLLPPVRFFMFAFVKVKICCEMSLSGSSSSSSGGGSG